MITGTALEIELDRDEDGWPPAVREQLVVRASRDGYVLKVPSLFCAIAVEDEFRLRGGKAQQSAIEVVQRSGRSLIWVGAIDEKTFAEVLCRLANNVYFFSRSENASTFAVDLAQDIEPTEIELLLKDFDAKGLVEIAYPVLPLT